MLKRLKYIGQCLEELSALGITGTDDTNPPSKHPNPSHSDAKLVLRPVVSPEAVAVGRKFQQELLRELPGLMGQPGEALRHHAAWYSPEVCTLLSLAMHQLYLCARISYHTGSQKAVHLVKAVVFTIHRLLTGQIQGLCLVRHSCRTRPCAVVELMLRQVQCKWDSLQVWGHSVRLFDVDSLLP